MTSGAGLPSGAGSAVGWPDVVLAGAARSGTSFLAARMSEHPGIDGGAIKEPNYFSQHLDRGPEWYDGLYQPRSPSLLRLDASMTYTSPRYLGALELVAEAAPDARVIYAVRDPLARAVSHYRLLSKYFSEEKGEDTFGQAIATNEVYLGASDYGRWLDLIVRLWGHDRLLVVPFDVTTQGSAATDAVFDFLGLPAHRLDAEAGEVQRNEVVEFRHAWMRPARRALRSTPVYPWLRRRLGADRVRRLRGLATRSPEPLSVEQALSSCTAAQRRDIAALVDRACAVATDTLVAQDARLGLDWAEGWRASLAGMHRVDEH